MGRHKGNLPSREQFDLMWAEDENGCWIWNGCVNQDGYGRFGSKLAHRVAHEFYVGEIPKPLEIDHLCRVRLCVNPEHMEVVTHAENLRRGEIGTYNAVKTHCPRGHEYAGDNLYRYNGRRHCKACRRKVVREGRIRRLSVASGAD